MSTNNDFSFRVRLAIVVTRSSPSRVSGPFNFASLAYFLYLSSRFFRPPALTPTQIRLRIFSSIKEIHIRNTPSSNYV